MSDNNHDHDHDPCTLDTLHSALVYLEQEARGMNLFFEAYLIGAAALAVQDTFEGRKPPKNDRPTAQSTTVYKSGP